MGQAKSRGTFEERVEQAKAREKEKAELRSKLPKPSRPRTPLKSKLIAIAALAGFMR